MKRLRAPGQSDSGASSPTTGATAGSLTSNSSAAPPISTPGTASTRVDASTKEQAPDTDTGVVQAPGGPGAAQRETEARERCNGQTSAQTQGDKTA